MNLRALGKYVRLPDPRVRTVIALLGAAVLVGSILGAVVAVRDDMNPEAAMVIRPAAAETRFAFRAHPVPRPVPNISFEDEKGVALTLSNFKGRVVLLNIWATWCPPCRKEMPTLDRLQQRLGGKDFEVVALSIDRGGAPVVREFFNDIGVKAVAVYVDRSAEATGALGVVGVPTTLLIGRNGQEIGRLVGPAEWDSPEAVETIRRYLTPTA